MITNPQGKVQVNQSLVTNPKGFQNRRLTLLKGQSPVFVEGSVRANNRNHTSLKEERVSDDSDLIVLYKEIDSRMYPISDR